MIDDIHNHIVKGWRVLAWICDAISVGLGLAFGFISNFVASIPLPDGSDWAKNLVLVAASIYVLVRAGHYVVKIYRGK